MPESIRLIERSETEARGVFENYKQGQTNDPIIKCEFQFLQRRRLREYCAKSDLRRDQIKYLNNIATRWESVVY